MRPGRLVPASGAFPFATRAVLLEKNATNGKKGLVGLSLQGPKGLRGFVGLGKIAFIIYHQTNASLGYMHAYQGLCGTLVGLIQNSVAVGFAGFVGLEAFRVEGAWVFLSV